MVHSFACSSGSFQTGQHLLHVLMERIEKGSTATLYCHGLQHVWDLPRLPIGASDEAGEAALRQTKRIEPILSTYADAAILNQGPLLVRSG